MNSLPMHSNKQLHKPTNKQKQKLTQTNANIKTKKKKFSKIYISAQQKKKTKELQAENKLRKLNRLNA